MHFNVQLQRNSKIRLNDNKIRKVLDRIAGAATRNQKHGFVIESITLDEPELIAVTEAASHYRYVAKISLQQTTARTIEKANTRFQRVLELVARRAGRLGWTVVEGNRRLKGDNDAAVIPVESAAEQAAKPASQLILPDLTPGVVQQAFKGIYEREPHIRLIHDAMRTFVASSGLKVSHVLLYGEPAAAKTSLFRRFKDLYDSHSDSEQVVFIDAQTMTKAGLENWLLDRAESGCLPAVLVVEELEKQDASVLLPLISVMGSGYVMKTNARIGRRVERTQIAVWGTCNNERLLRSFHDGALWSRFTHKLPCTRPSRELMRLILLREIEDRQGNPLWADAALSLGYEELGTDDPREIIGLLDGGERLLTGTYQADYRDILQSARQVHKLPIAQAA